MFLSIRIYCTPPALKVTGHRCRREWAWPLRRGGKDHSGASGVIVESYYERVNSLWTLIVRTARWGSEPASSNGSRGRRTGHKYLEFLSAFSVGLIMARQEIIGKCSHCGASAIATVVGLQQDGKEI